MLPQVKTIIYASDLGENTRPVIRMAASLAKSQNARLICLHILEPISDYIHNIVGTAIERSTIDNSFKENISESKKLMQQRIDLFVEEEFKDTKLPFEPEVKVIVGQVEQVILETAKEENADLIVMGSRTHSTIGRFVLGSNANKIIHSSKFPVMIVPIH